MNAAHLGMTVRDVERTLDFYCGVLGADLMWRPSTPRHGPQVDTIFELEGTRVLIAGIDLHGIVIEFFQFLTPPVDDATYRTSYTTGGWKHLCLTVDDIDAEVARLSAAGVIFRHPVQLLPNGTKMAYFDDPDGVMLELNQPSETDHAIRRR
jgi:catechol 2,3-dioxygenase-like lactoylglutathione lyase family enzyme